MNHGPSCGGSDKKGGERGQFVTGWWFWAMCFFGVFDHCFGENCS